MAFSDRRDTLVWAGRLQARLCREGGSLTYARIIDDLVCQVERGDGVGGSLLLSDPDEPRRSAIYLRLLAAVDRLIQDRPDSPLCRWYPRHGGTESPAAAVAAFNEVLNEAADVLAKDMRRTIQTNEVGRSAIFAAALSEVALHTGQPCQLREVGASAGLNLSLDRFRIEIGDNIWGDPESKLVLSSRFRRPPTRVANVSIVDRAGCDVSPLDPASPDDVRLLRSFIWPEQLQRARDLDAGLALGRPGLVEQADASTWLAEQAEGHRDGATMVVLHSVVTTYFSQEEHRTWLDSLAALMTGARGSRRVAWISLEPDQDTRLELRLALDDPQDQRVLATCTPHGYDIDWLDP